jgi:formylglycine-generating enzyme required for sulfatase activity
MVRRWVLVPGGNRGFTVSAFHCEKETAPATRRGPALTASGLIAVLAFSLVTQPEPAPKGAPKQKNSPPKEFSNSIGMKFVWIEPGRFMMGSPEDEPDRGPNPQVGPHSERQHKVTLTKGFYMGV